MSEALSWLLIILAAGDVGVTAILAHAARHEHNAALTERAWASIVLTCVAVIAAILSAAFLTHTILPSGLSLLLLGGGLVLVSLPQFVWLASYTAGRFR